MGRVASTYACVVCRNDVHDLSAFDITRTQALLLFLATIYAWILSVTTFSSFVKDLGCGVGVSQLAL